MAYAGAGHTCSHHTEWRGGGGGRGEEKLSLLGSGSRKIKPQINWAFFHYMLFNLMFGSLSVK